MSAPPEPVFEAPWHAELFALTVHLSETGHFDWAVWADLFGATLRRHGTESALDGGDDYFMAWLETLEGLLLEKGLASEAEIELMRAAWENAFLNTEHGEPVSLDG